MMADDHSLPFESGEPSASFRKVWIREVQRLMGAALEPPRAGETADAWAQRVGADGQTRFVALMRSLGIASVDDLSRARPWVEYLRSLDIAFSRDHGIMGLQHNGSKLLAICGPRGWRAVDIARRLLGVAPQVVWTTEAELGTAINRLYESQETQTQDYIDSIDDVTVRVEGNSSDTDLLDQSGQGPIVRMVNLILFEAVKAGASDIHIQPTQDRVVVRQRIDGCLFDAFEIPKPIQEQVLTRIKVLANMNIAEKRLPQDGRATIHVGDRQVDLRIASLPTSHNERIVVRLLDKSARLYQLGELGMGQDELHRYRRMIGLDHGMILVTGPTGSGKTTTLYASLLEVNTTDLNVLSIEDPIEYQLDGVSQIQTNEKKGLTFAAGLRSILRQDPDIIMVGEIRDQETAAMAVQASLTGHLVFSTLHTNDAASSVARLLDLGIEPYLVASSLVGVLAQRLVRKICDHCKVADTSPDTLRDAESLQVSADGMMRGAGCEKCRGTGFRGRLGVFEFLCVDEQVQSIIQQRANATTIREAAIGSGMKLLHEDGFQKVALGKTTVQEIMRVSRLAVEE